MKKNGPVPAGVASRRRTLSMRSRHELVGLSFVSPFIVGFAVLFLVPFLRTFVISVGGSHLYLFKMDFAGLDYYKRAFVSDVQFIPTFLQVIRETAIDLVLITVISLFIAIMLNRNIRGRSVFRVICFLPVMIGSGYVMELLLGQQISAASLEMVKDILLPREITNYMGADVTNGISYFLEKLTVILWHSGVQIIIFLSGLQSIPSSLYEAARVDSATEWESLWFITMPMLSPIIMLNMVYTVVDSFNSSANPMILFLKDRMFVWGQHNYAAALGIMYFLVILVLIGLIFLFFRKAADNVKS